MIGECDIRSNLEARQEVVLYPTFGSLAPEDLTWRIPVAGAVFEPVPPVGLRKRILLRMLQRFMRAPQEALESEIFQRRIRGFLTATERGKQIVLRIGEQSYRLPRPSTRSGMFTGVIHLAQDELSQLELSGELHGGWLRFSVATPDGDGRDFYGYAQLVPPTGLSVVSDIDDTIKQTQVHCRRSTLTNTFLRELEPIAGMADVYRRLAGWGGVFHYVSSSPWQLYEALAELCGIHGFPAGSFHLRSFRLRDHMLRRIFPGVRSGKSGVIKSVLQEFPQRQFVLIGDSGERDPEIYGAVTRLFPEQVTAIWIRQTPGREMTPARLSRAFRQVDPERLCLFRDPMELEPQLARVR